MASLDGRTLAAHLPVAVIYNIMARNFAASALISKQTLWPYSATEMNQRIIVPEVEPHRQTTHEMFSHANGKTVKQQHLLRWSAEVLAGGERHESRKVHGQM